MATRGRKGNSRVTLHSQEVNFSLDNTTVATALAGGTVFANSFRDGDVLNLRAFGDIGTVGAAPGTLTVEVLVGGTAIVTYVSATLATTLTDEPFFINADVILRSLGTAGTAVAGISVQSGEVTLDGAASQSTAQAVNTTTDTAVTLRFTWSVADALNVLDVEGLTITV